MNGCCVDNESGSPRGCTEDTCMQLPEGKTCGDCAHIGRCVAMFGMKPSDTSCSFFPRRFRLPVIADGGAA